MTPPAIALERAWAHVEPEPNSGCWLWVGARGPKGYGNLWVLGKLVGAYRFFYEQFKGPVPEGLELDHLCRTPPCVNPAHLEPVTSRTNTLRGKSPSAIHATQTHCLRGHAFDAANTRLTRRGTRDCRACFNYRQNIRRRVARGES